MKSAQTAEIRTILLANITEGRGNWQELMAAISQKHKIKNWMTVRGQIQALKDQRIIKRIPSVHEETYVLEIH